MFEAMSPVIAKLPMARPEARKILIVISDGAPVDDNTLSLMPSNYLDNHLRYVIRQIETNSKIELRAIGIGHDVTRYYKHALTMKDVTQLGETLIGQLTDLLSAPKLLKSTAFG